MSIYSLKLVSAIFYQILIFLSNDRRSKTKKNVYISTKMLFSFLRYSDFYNFSRFKRANGRGITCDVTYWLG